MTHFEVPPNFFTHFVMFLLFIEFKKECTENFVCQVRCLPLTLICQGEKHCFNSIEHFTKNTKNHRGNLILILKL